MVYRGRPSKACRECRTRRLRCSQHPLPSGCSQCFRAQLVCSGYRDQSQIRLANQTQDVVAKCQEIRAPVKSKTYGNVSIPQSMLQSVELQARDLFFADYVFGNLTAFDYLRDFYFSTTVDEHLSLGIEATSLAYFSTQKHSPEALKKARAKYGSALTKTNTCLQTPLATSDTTLLTILLLDLFDKLMDRSPHDFQSWTSHMIGALALIRLRGPQQFSNVVGLRMFLQFSANLILNCIQLEVALPQEYLSMRAYAGQFLNANDSKWYFTELMIRFVQLRVAMKEKTLSALETIKVAQKLDSEFDILSVRKFSQYPYCTICVDSPRQGVFDGYFHIYSDHNVAHTWNIIRIARTLLNEIIHDSRDAGQEGDLVSVVPTINRLVAEICASVPQYTSLPPHANDYLLTSNLSGANLHQSYSTFHSSRCYSLLYPLYVAGQSKHASSRVRPWVIEQLHFLASSFGIKKAEALVGILEREESRNPWSIYAMLGSNAFAA